VHKVLTGVQENPLNLFKKIKFRSKINNLFLIACELFNKSEVIDLNYPNRIHTRLIYK
jgi:hypothetical protein